MQAEPQRAWREDMARPSVHHASFDGSSTPAVPIEQRQIVSLGGWRLAAGDALCDFFEPLAHLGDLARRRKLRHLGHLAERSSDGEGTGPLQMPAAPEVQITSPQR